TGEEKARLEIEIDRLEKRLVAQLHDTALADDTFDWCVRFVEEFVPPSGRAPGFEIVLANPPYGEGAVTESVRNNLFGRNSGQSKDIYAAFMARAFHLLACGGMMSFITSNTWRTIRTHRPLRNRILAQATIL